MSTLPTRFAGLILVFAPLFVHRSWRHAQVLLVGAILTLIGGRWPACCGSWAARTSVAS